ncbi:MAG: GNAT family N-acetyltransferase [Anaerolineaceae bacterium]|nr:GNAT family N-acetyltransferase [Anaerolineaceae bacterium]
MTAREQIHTDRLIIRAFLESDTQDLYEYLSDPQIYRYEPGEPIDQQQAQNYASEMANKDHFWAVALESYKKVIGQLYFSQLEPEHLMTWELGYRMSPKYQNQGYGSESAQALVDYGFRELHVHRVVAYCHPDNVASWKLLEKIGFRREGLLRKNIHFRYDAEGNPLWWDSFAYARLEDKYEANIEAEK